MSLISKFIALKNYIPLGQPSLADFTIRTEEIKLEDNNQVLVSNEVDFSRSLYARSYDRA